MKKLLKAKDVIRAALPVVFAEVVHPRGVDIWITGTDEELIQAGAVKPGEFPPPRRGAFRWNAKSTRVCRGTLGRCKVWLFGICAARQDIGFQDFMRGLLADSQLSLVAHEKGNAA